MTLSLVFLVNERIHELPTLVDRVEAFTEANYVVIRGKGEGEANSKDLATGILEYFFVGDDDFFGKAPDLLQVAVGVRFPH